MELCSPLSYKPSLRALAPHHSFLHTTNTRPKRAGKLTNVTAGPFSNILAQTAKTLPVTQPYLQKRKANESSIAGW